MSSFSIENNNKKIIKNKNKTKTPLGYSRMLGAIKCYFMCVALLQNILLAAHHRNTMRFRIYEGMGRGNETVEKISGEKKKKKHEE